MQDVMLQQKLMQQGTQYDIILLGCINMTTDAS